MLGSRLSYLSVPDGLMKNLLSLLRLAAPLAILAALPTAALGAEEAVPEDAAKAEAASSAEAPERQDAGETPEAEIEVADAPDDEAEDNVEAYLRALSARKSFSEERDDLVREACEKALVPYGWYSPEIEVRHPEKGKIEVRIGRGERTLYREVRIETAAESPEEGRIAAFAREKSHEYGIEKGKPLIHPQYEAFKSDITAKLISDGYFNGKITNSTVVVSREEAKADLSFTIEPGTRFTYGKITMEGFEESHGAVKGLVSVKEGDLFSALDLASVNQTLYETGYYKSVIVRPDMREMDSGNSLVPVRIGLKAKPRNLTEWSLGYSTDEGPRGSVSWKRPFAGSRGQSWKSALSVSGVTQAANFSYYIPRENPIDDYYRLSAEYRHKDLNDTEFQNLTVGGHYFTRTHGRWERDYFIETSFESYDQSDDSDDVFLLMPGAEISRLTTDGTTDPASGERIRLSARFSSEKLLLAEDFVILDAFYRRIWSPTDGSRLVIRAEQGAILGSSIDDVPSSLRFFAGGDQSVRGFGYEKISPKNSDGELTGAKYLTVGSVELQVPVMNKVRMAIFADAGTATNDYGDDSDDIKVGTGLGVRYISPVGPIRADIGVGVSETHIPIRLHFGLGLDL